MSGLPKGWENTTLGEVCSKPQYGWTSKAGKTGRLKYLRTTDISGGIINWDTVPYCVDEPDNFEKYKLEKNDILVSRAGSVGVSHRLDDVPCDVVFASYLIRFKALEGIVEPKFIGFFLRSNNYWRAISEFTAGIAIPNVNASKLSDLEVPLPPLGEQQRIVAKLEELLEKVEACQNRLEKIPVILKRFRQAVLASACSGRLTEDWREENGKDLDEWTVSVLGEVANLRLGKMLDQAKNIGEPTRYLRNINVRWFSFNLADLAEMRATQKDRLELSIRDGDLFVCEGGEPGRCAVWISGATDLIFQKAIHRVRPQEQISSDWLSFSIKNDADSGRLEDYFTGTTIKHLTGKGLSKYEFAVPPLPEQHEIVHRVKALFALAEELETRYQKAKEHVDKLIQSILSKAFRGELVPQEENDEPASVLLKRIRAQRAEFSPAKRSAVPMRRQKQKSLV